MRFNWKYIVLPLLIVLIMLSYYVGNQRNKARVVELVDIEFVDDAPPFIAHNAVNKLLIQNEAGLTGLLKEKVVLNEMEGRLEDHDMVQDAEVFLTIDGKIGAKIKQREPVARVVASPHYYLDSEGRKMPLSEVYTARVPLITGISERQHRMILPLVLRLAEDPLLHQLVTGMRMTAGDQVVLYLRSTDLAVRFGSPDRMEQKIRNFKAFYQKADRDGVLEEYKSVDLQFGNQVVATKR